MDNEKIIVRLDKNLLFTYVNEAWLTFFGTKPDECIGLPIFDFILPDNIDATKKQITSWQQSKEDSILMELPHISRNGENHQLVWNFILHRDEQNNILEFSGTGSILDRGKIHEEWLMATEFYKNSSEAIIITDENFRIIGVNPAFEKITGYSRKDALYKNSSLLDSDLQHSLYETIRYKTLPSGNWRGEIWCKRKNGDHFAAHVIISTLFAEENIPYRRVAILSDITNKKLSKELIRQQQHSDSLTGLPNRNFLKEEALRIEKRTQPVALILLDLDDFKSVNDTLGHDTGDLLLIAVARRLKTCTSGTDLLIRLGGDEFAVLLTENITPDRVKQLADSILKNLAKPYCIGNEAIHLSTSMGITFYPEDGKEIDSLLINADQAMYSAKNHGKNQFHYFTQSMQDAAKSRMQIINDLRQVLDGKQFKIMYQPIVELSTGIIHKAEALIRWQHPTKGLINPIDFISIAEDTGMIVSFGNWVFYEAAKQVSIWREKHHPKFQIDINISPVQFRNEGINSIDWLQHLEELAVPGEGIVVEITERLFLKASDQVKKQLYTLRQAGIEIALDDFGVGYSSLSYLQKFQIDYIKIDRTFVENLSQESDNLILCEAIIVMAHKLGMKVIAEGIETPLQQELLTNAGCDFGQGYLYSRALPADQFDALLKNNNA